jgi:tripartite-type tricarboxylate transporter receptor subunit TctC
MWRVLTLLLVLVAEAGRLANAQDYPQKPVRAITALSAGGTSDVFMRVLGDQFQKRTGQPIVVENRPGGALNIGGQACADAPPDGYTICLLPVETLAYNQFLFKKLAYDANAFVPITNVFFVTAVLIVNSSLGVRSLDTCRRRYHSRSSWRPGVNRAAPTSSGCLTRAGRTPRTPSWLDRRRLRFPALPISLRTSVPEQ